MISILLLPEAEMEFMDSVRYYESKKKGLGIKFKDEIKKALAEIKRNPGIAASREGVYHYVLKRFPYIIVYRVSSEKIVVIAIAHVRRMFGYWKQRLNGGSKENSQ